MSDLRFEDYTMPAAELQPDNPLPNLIVHQDAHAKIVVDPKVPEEIRRHIGYGRVNGCLPYGVQDHYDRNKRPTAFRVAVLENEILRATFLLERGGRLWSLVHKPTNRELLYVNPVFQPANLAIRNAWFSGGVEWNIGMTGHTPLTCAPMFAARLKLDDGTPVLRLYEWERIRQLAYQLDAYLPDGSSMLFVRVKIVNPHDRECPMYWWSNMAVPEAPGTRVLVPAESAYQLDYETGMKEIPIPFRFDTDISYPTHIDRCIDFFFRVADGQRPWIASLDQTGRGLVQTSTARLRGRKLFVWGMARGGRHWQEFLSVPGKPYVEIQAGLARTQSECLPMPAHAEWAWLEAYGLMEADPVVAHAPQWTPAWQAVARQLDALAPAAALEADLARTAAMAARAPGEIVQRGSGWGALECKRRKAAGESPFSDGGLVFDDATLGTEQEPWLQLLRNGVLPRREPGESPGAGMVQPEWKALLERSVTTSAGDHWLAWLHLGVMRYYAGDVAGARAAWERSLSQERSAWALRNLAVLEQQAKHADAAAKLWLKAWQMAPAQYQLAIECGLALLQAGQADRCLELVAGLTPALQSAGRIRFLEARTRLALGEFEAAEQILRGLLAVEDLREGEGSLTDLWFSVHEQRLAARENIPIDDALKQRVRRDFPPPAHIEFRGQDNAG